jgi:acyl phosphate:glycerol-3-phosphate acyltransferase
MSESHIAMLAALAFGYALGSIPFGLIFTRLAGLGDIRAVGSGNIGATNVLRTGRKELAAATLICDAGKGALAVVLARQFGPQILASATYAPWPYTESEAELALNMAHFGESMAVAAGFGAFVGHVFPVWLGFRGGKGVATYIGVLMGVHWPAGLIFCAVWILAAAASRYSSLGALTAAAITPAVLAAMGHWPAAALMAVLSLLLYTRHSGNIGRLLRGEESKIGQRKS